MKIAVTYENGNVYQHFGHTEHFKIFEIENNEIKSEKVVSTNGSGHGALAGFLKSMDIDVLICGGIGGGAKLALADSGIQLFGGVTGIADEAVLSYMNGTLKFVPDITCAHHEHEGHENCGEHGCGNHSCEK